MMYRAICEECGADSFPTALKETAIQDAERHEQEFGHSPVQVVKGVLG